MANILNDFMTGTTFPPQRRPNVDRLIIGTSSCKWNRLGRHVMPWSYCDDQLGWASAFPGAVAGLGCDRRLGWNSAEFDCFTTASA
jgi:hypothetical protein